MSEKISDFSTITTIAFDDLLIAVVDTTSNGTKNITFGDLIKNGVSSDTGNLLGSDTNGLNKLTFDDQLKSTDADNLLAKGADNKIRLEADTDLISSDSGNALQKSSTDKKLFVDANYAEAKVDLRGISLLKQKIGIANSGGDADHDIAFTAGNFIFDDGTGQSRGPTFTKQIDALWASGSLAGGLDTGTVANNTWYAIYAIYNPTTTFADYLFSASFTAPTLPSGYTKKKLIGALLTDGSANILPGKWIGNVFKFTTAISNTFDTTITTSNKTVNLSVPPTKVRPILGWTWVGNNGTLAFDDIILTSDLQGEFKFKVIKEGAGSSFSASFDSIANQMIISNAQIQYKTVTASVTGTQGQLYTNGYELIED